MTKKCFFKYLFSILIALQANFYAQFCIAALPNFAEKFLSEKEKAFIQANPVIIVGGEKDWLPFDFVNPNGEYTGLCRDYLNLVSEKTGLKFQFKIANWNELLIKMDDGEIDLLPAIYRTPERAAKYHFTSSYHQISEYIFSRSDAVVNKPEDLFGKTVAIVKDFATISVLKKHYPQINILETNNVDETINAVVTFKADFLFDSLAVINYKLRQKSITNIKPAFAFKNYQLQKIYMATRQELPLLASIISKVIDNLEEHEKQRILLAWLGHEELKNLSNNTTSNNLNLNEIEKAYLSNHPVLRWGYDVDWSPIEFFDSKEKQVKGIAADHIHAIEKLLGIKIKAVTPDSWTNMLKNTREGKIDLLSAIAKTSEREKYLLFTEPYITFPMVVISKQERPYISHLAMLSDLKIAVVEKYMSHDILQEKFPEFNLFIAKDLETALLAVEKAEADVFVGNLATSSHAISDIGLTHLKIIGQTSYSYELTIAVPKNQSILKDILQKALNQIDEQQSNAIYQKWLRVSYQKEVDLRIVWIILLASSILIGLFIYWNRKLVYLNQTINTYLDIIDLHVITVSTDEKGTITDVSDAFCYATGYQREDLIGKKYRVLKSKRNSAQFYKGLSRRLTALKTWKGELEIQGKDGHYFWLDMTIAPNFKRHHCIGYTAIGHDITDKKQLEQRAITDDLTGLYNRRHFNSLFFNERNRAKRENKVFAFFMIDVDNFKKYNDNYGHQKGDEALIIVAQKLQETLKRSSDKAFRLGGEEFGCLIAVNKQEEVLMIAEKVRQSIEAANIEHLYNLPYKRITVSIGVCFLLPNDKQEHLEFVYHQADELLYEAKHRGRNTIAI